jgi:endonuclease YncB( thermonuclease family)
MQLVRVLRIVDGDTLHVEIGGVDETVRIFGIDTAERGERCFDEASVRLEQLAGIEIRLLADERARDRFGRVLRYVYAPDGLSIDAALVREGLAYAWRDDGRLRDALIATEDAARAARVGCLWR